MISFWPEALALLLGVWVLADRRWRHRVRMSSLKRGLDELGRQRRMVRPPVDGRRWR